MNNQKIKNIELINNNVYDEIHWWQFPLADFSIKLDKKFMCDFFNKIQSERSKSLIFASYINTQSKKYNKNWNFKRQRLLIWYYKDNNEFVPAWFVYEVATYLRLNLFEIEQKITAYITFRGKIVIDSKFPIKVTPEFSSILSHMICDGTVMQDRFFYFQKNKEHLERFIIRGHSVPLIFKNVISDYFIASNFGSLDCNLTAKVFQLPKLHKVAILAGALLDDGHSVSCVRFYTASVDFAQSLRKLAESINYRCTPIVRRKPKFKDWHFLYTFNISAESIPKFYEDLTELFKLYPLLHIGKKYENIKRFVEIRNRGWKQRAKGNTIKIILFSLEESEKTSYDLSSIANISLYTTYHHLQKLMKAGKVTKYKKFKRQYVYRLIQ